MDLFYFSGSVAPSKSLLNRALIIQQFNSCLEWAETSEANDVVYLQQALRDFNSGQKKFFCGDGGTTFRFFVIFLSRFPGIYEIEVAPQLRTRPHQGLQEFFEQVQVHFHWEENIGILKTQGWQGDTVQLITDQTSQIASAIMLCLWKLPRSFQLLMTFDLYHYEYFQMTFRMNQSLGFQTVQSNVQNNLVCLNVDAEQVPVSQMIRIEPDVSSCFPLAVLGALKQPVHLHNFPIKSWQPDCLFLQIFSQANVAFDLDHNGLKVFPSLQMKAFEIDINQAPDLFPVLCVLACFCQGSTIIRGLSRLAFKESDRLQRTMVLLKLHGVHCEVEGEHVHIEGQDLSTNFSLLSDLQKVRMDFDPTHDHRMAMAAIIFQVMGSNIKLQNIDVLQKSFPEFTTLVRPLMPNLLIGQLPGGLIE